MMESLPYCTCNSTRRYLDGRELGESNVTSHSYDWDRQLITFVSYIDGEHTVTCRLTSSNGSVITHNTTYLGLAPSGKNKTHIRTPTYRYKRRGQFIQVSFKTSIREQLVKTAYLMIWNIVKYLLRKCTGLPWCMYVAQYYIFYLILTDI